MRFGRVALDEAEGAVLAHSVAIEGQRWRKAHRLTRTDLDAMRAGGLTQIVVARLAEDDLDEDEAASRIAGALRIQGIVARPAATGRVNFHAKDAGLLRVDAALVDAINAVDARITVATLADYSTVARGQMAATVKIIPFAVPEDKVSDVQAIAAEGTALDLHAFTAMRFALIQTMLPSVKATVLDKTARTLADRLARSHSRIVVERRTAHDERDIASAIEEVAGLCDAIVIFGASAMSDDDDVIPAAIRLAEGHVERVGMPVDPGNLLVLGSVGSRPVIGAPGCARSPRPNGFDWVLDRVLAGLSPTSGQIAAMGVGGLLMEIPTRPHPREHDPDEAPRASNLAGIVLAAGRSSRMGGPNKLLARFGGQPLVRQVAQRLRDVLPSTLVVVGHQGDRIRSALDGVDLTIIENSEYGAGLSTSLRTGIEALPPGCDGALIMLADMPAVSALDLARLADAFGASGGEAVVRATSHGRAGNPVILPACLFAAVASLTGDQGARSLVEESGLDIVEVEIGEGASTDVDTPDALAAAGGTVDA